MGTLQSQPLTCDVVVVGLGPVGAITANLLAHCGLSVIAIDKEPQVLNIPRGVGIDGEIMRAMQTLGLAEKLEPFLKVFRGAQYIDAEGKVVATRPPANHSGSQGWPDRYNVHQPELEQVLREGFEKYLNLTELTSTILESIDQEDDGVTVSVRSLTDGTEHKISTKYVVGADGGKSTVRRLIGASYHDYGLNQPWIVADFAVTEDAEVPEINTHYADPVSPAIYIHVVRNIRRFEFRATPDENLAAAVEPEKIWHRVSKWISPNDAELLRAAVYTHRSLVVDEWRSGRILLAGDAAHQTPPFLGQGLCTGVRDAVSIAWRLRDVISRGAPESLLESYGPERSDHARYFIKTATELGTKLTKPTKESIDALNSRVGREGRGKPPQLGAGIYDEKHQGGVLSSQPHNNDKVLVDDISGYEFSLIIDQALQDNLSARDLKNIELTGLQVVTADAALTEWLMSHDTKAALIRPDRYLFGLYNDAAELAAGLELLGSYYSPSTLIAV